MDKLNVVVIGDSVMWGQGLKTADKFYVLASARIAQSLSREVSLFNDNPRSGAKLLAAPRSDRTRRVVIDENLAGLYGVKVTDVVDHRSIEITLPSGRAIKTVKGDRAKFYDTYPAFFETDAQVIAFLDGSDEEPARRLFGEIPATFPTITYQAESVDDQLAKTIDLVIMDGSVNDVDFEGVLDSLDGPEIAKIDLAIRNFSYEELKKLLLRVRKKFSNAVILVTGYFSPFSQRSDRDRLEQLAKYLSGRSDFQIWANDQLTSSWGEVFLAPVRLGLSFIGIETVDVDAAVSEAIFRSEFAQSRGVYWMRRAITELYESGSAGPGLYFVNPSFKPENSLFGSNSFLHEGYKSPEETPSHDHRHEVHDAALRDRLARIPRRNLMKELDRANQALVQLLFAITFKPEEVDAAKDAARNVLNNLDAPLDGPISLKKHLAEALKDLSDNAILSLVIGALNLEIGRISHGEIASFLHPNEAGARQYADKIVERYNRHRQISVRSDLSKLASSDLQNPHKEIRVKHTLSRYGLDPKTGLRACLQHMDVDSIAIEIKSLSSPPIFGGHDVFLNVGNRKRFRLNNPFGTLSTIDTFGSLHLGDISELIIEVDNGRMEFREFRLSINGRIVFRSPREHHLKKGDKVRFAYPS